MNLKLPTLGGLLGLLSSAIDWSGVATAAINTLIGTLIALTLGLVWKIKVEPWVMRRKYGNISWHQRRILEIEEEKQNAIRADSTPPPDYPTTTEEK